MDMSEKKNQIHFTLANSLTELESLSAHVEAAAEKWQLPRRTALQLNLILDEFHFPEVEPVSFSCMMNSH